MGARQTLTIRNYYNGGGDLTIAVKESVVSEKTEGGGKIVRLRITRKPDRHSSRLGMFAYLRNTNPNYRSLGFSEATLIFDMFSTDGRFLSRTLVVFSGVAVEKSERVGDNEEITFIAHKKSEELAISNVVGIP